MLKKKHYEKKFTKNFECPNMYLEFLLIETKPQRFSNFLLIVKHTVKPWNMKKSVFSVKIAFYEVSEKRVKSTKNLHVKAI